MKNKVQEDLTQAMRERDAIKTGALRMLLAALVNKEKEKMGEPLSEEEAQQVVKREIKKRMQAAEAFEKAGRAESAEKEKKEMEVLQRYYSE